jgi:hypothetical protein
MNVPIDTDGDGLYDLLRCGDYDRDGSQEMADVAACIAALTDTGGAHLIVSTGVYAPYATGGVPGANEGVLEIALDNFTLDCEPGAVLTGMSDTKTAAADDVSTVYVTVNAFRIANCEINGDYYDSGGILDFTASAGGATTLTDSDTSVDFTTLVNNRATVILRPGGASVCKAASSPWSCCTGAGAGATCSEEVKVITGTTSTQITVGSAWTNNPANGDHYSVGYTGSSGTQNTRMGIRIANGVDHIIENNYVHDTHHACIYVADSETVRVHQNRMEDCGGFYDVTGTGSQPGVYLFANADSTLSDAKVTENSVRRSGESAYNTRKASSSTSVVKNVVMSDNYAYQGSVDADGIASPCLTLGSLQNATVTNLLCEQTSTGIVFTGGATYLSSSTTEPYSNRDVMVDNVVVRNTIAHYRTGQAFGVNVGDYQENVRISNLIVDTTYAESLLDSNASCVLFNSPQRNLAFERVLLKNCAHHGIYQNEADGTAQGEGIRWIDVTVSGTDYYIPGGSTVRAPFNTATRHCARFTASAYNQTFVNFSCEDATGNGLNFEADADFITVKDSRFDMRPFGWYTGAGTAGIVTEAQAAAATCNSGATNTWLITSDAAASGGGACVAEDGEEDTTDVTFGSGTSTCNNRAYCNGTSWTNGDLTTQHGINFSNTGTSHALVDGIECKGVQNSSSYCVNFANVTATNNKVGTVTIRAEDGAVAGRVFQADGAVQDSTATLVKQDAGPGSGNFITCIATDTPASNCNP